MVNGIHFTQRYLGGHPAPPPRVKERHSLQKPGLFDLRGGDNSVVTFPLKGTPRDQAEVRGPIFLGLSILAPEDRILGKLGELVVLVFC